MSNENKCEMLARLKADCLYFLAHDRKESNLFTKKTSSQIALMRMLAEDINPEWLTSHDIDVLDYCMNHIPTAITLDEFNKGLKLKQIHESVIDTNLHKKGTFCRLVPGPCLEFINLHFIVVNDHGEKIYF